MISVITPQDFGASIKPNKEGRYEAVAPVMNVAFDAANSKLVIPTTATNAVLFLTRTDTGTLETLEGGVQGQIIYLRYAQGVAIRNTSSIRLIDGKASLTLLDSNKVSTFLCLAPNVWTEISRNFS